MTFNLKTLLVILTLASLPCALNGQSYSIDHQAGAILKLVSARMNISSDLVSTSSTEAEVGYQFGGFYRINIDKIYVQPEVLFSKIKTQLVFNDYNGSSMTITVFQGLIQCLNLSSIPLSSLLI